MTKVLGTLSQNSGSPLTISDTAKQIGIERSVIEKKLKIGIKLGIVVQVGKNRYVSTELLNKLKASAEKMSLVSADGQFTTIAYRDEINMGRNFAIVILEYFDRTGFTVRVGEYRRLNRHRSKTES